ncbi:unnamed protein product [Adineta steineri]|uniref:MATH domain-containing protein n=1 Tax=Adineta steineri TaxID=433720 RepID=A0A813SQH8_9BILA|nr:unnamed protein product [Adineta steineri]CAF1173882.1 unnamed protein product [Adineta steineri]
MNETFSKCDGTDEPLDVSYKRSCPLGIYDCRDIQINRNSLQEHYLSEQHQRSLVRRIQQFIESTNDDSTKTNIDKDKENTSIQSIYEKLSILTQNIETTYDTLDQLSSDVHRCNNQNCILASELKDIKDAYTLENAHINASSLNQNVLKHDMIDLKEEINIANERIHDEYNGMMVWKITDIHEKRTDAQSERKTSVYSYPFYTSKCGYKLCLRLYLNGDGAARDTHLSLFLVILRGEYDALLEWPFSYRVSFCLCDQRTMIETNGTTEPKHIIESFRPDPNSVSFKRPTSTMNIASGIPKFFPLDQFNRPANENLYVVNDTIFIKAMIDFAKVPRSLLPFIFRMDISLPEHIRQKLIENEIERRQIQNIN